MFKETLKHLWRKRRKPSAQAEEMIALYDQMSAADKRDYARVHLQKYNRHQPPLPPPKTPQEFWLRIGFAILVSPQMVGRFVVVLFGMFIGTLLFAPSLQAPAALTATAAPVSATLALIFTPTASAIVPPSTTAGVMASPTALQLTSTHTLTPTQTATLTPTPIVLASPTQRVFFTLTPTLLPSPTDTDVPTATPSATATLMPRPTATSTATPSAVPPATVIQPTPTNTKEWPVSNTP